jgi:hypothetical protein
MTIISSSVKSTQSFASALVFPQVVMYMPFSSRKTKWAIGAPKPLFFFIQRMIGFVFFAIPQLPFERDGRTLPQHRQACQENLSMLWGEMSLLGSAIAMTAKIL